jgi:hypothetical protein
LVARFTACFVLSNYEDNILVLDGSRIREQRKADIRYSEEVEYYLTKMPPVVNERGSMTREPAEKWTPFSEGLEKNPMKELRILAEELKASQNSNLIPETGQQLETAESIQVKMTKTTKYKKPKGPPQYKIKYLEPDLATIETAMVWNSKEELLSAQKFFISNKQKEASSESNDNPSSENQNIDDVAF